MDCTFFLYFSIQYKEATGDRPLKIFIMGFKSIYWSYSQPGCFGFYSFFPFCGYFTRHYQKISLYKGYARGMPLQLQDSIILSLLLLNLQLFIMKSFAFQGQKKKKMTVSTNWSQVNRLTITVGKDFGLMYFFYFNYIIRIVNSFLLAASNSR